MNALKQKSWSPYTVGAALGVLSWFAFATADHGLGITTAFENTAALVGQAVPGVKDSYPYYAAKAGEGKSPQIDWEWMLVLGVFLGAWASSRFSGDRPGREEDADASVPAPWRARFGGSVVKRWTAALLGGALMMFGARIAQGCTSGHAITGALQLAVSSWIFALVIFPVGIATAFLLYGKEGRRHV